MYRKTKHQADQVAESLRAMSQLYKSVDTSAERPVDLCQRQSYLVLMYLVSLKQTDIPTEIMPSLTFYLFPRGVCPTEGQGTPG